MGQTTFTEVMIDKEAHGDDKAIADLDNDGIKDLILGGAGGDVISKPRLAELEFSACATAGARVAAEASSIRVKVEDFRPSIGKLFRPDQQRQRPGIRTGSRAGQFRTAKDQDQAGASRWTAVAGLLGRRAY